MARLTGEQPIHLLWLTFISGLIEIKSRMEVVQDVWEELYSARWCSTAAVSLVKLHRYRDLCENKYVTLKSWVSSFYMILTIMSPVKIVIALVWWSLLGRLNLNHNATLQSQTSFPTFKLTLPSNMFVVFLQLTPLHSLKLTFSGGCAVYVWCDVLIVCHVGLYGRPVVCDVKLEFYYLWCALLGELQRYLDLGNSLGEGNVVLQLQNGRLIWTNICSRGEERIDWKRRIRRTLSLICPLSCAMLSWCLF